MTRTSIEIGVPMPPKRSHRYPWADLAIEDSFFVPGDDLNALQRKMTRLAAYQKKTHGRCYTVRQVEGGVRVWRVS